MDLKAIAGNTIPASTGAEVLNKRGGITTDIIAEVLAAFNDSRGQLNQFAPHLKAATLQQTLFNVWKFWKSNIKYQVDPKGKQLVKEPKALWYLKVGDCKSLSVAVMSTLNSLGIKAAFRFTGYNGNDKFPTHVYVVVKDKGELIPVDCVWKNFGEQKTPFTKNWDYNMPTDIYRVSGFDDADTVGSPFLSMQTAMAKFKNIGSGKLSMPFPGMKNLHGKQIITAGPKGISDARKHHKHKCKCSPVRGKLVLPPGDITHEQLLVLLKKQGLEIEQENHVINGGIGAIGSTEDMAYEIQITGLHNAAAPFMGWQKKRLVGLKNPTHIHKREHSICGIANGNMIITNGNGEQIAFDVDQANEAAAHIEGFFGSLWSGIKSVGKAIGKGVSTVAKTAIKIVKAPVNLLVKGVKAVGKFAGKILTKGARTAVQQELPQIAPFFLYTYLAPELLPKMPPVVITKRNKALEYKALITGKLQLNAANFDATVRNSIMVAFRDTPENVIASWIKTTGYPISGIDFKAVIDTAKGVVNFLPNVLRSFMGNLGENLPQDAEMYMPAIEDFGGVSPQAAAALSNGVQATSPQPYTTQQLYDQVQSGQYQQNALPSYYTPSSVTPTNSNYDFSGGGSAANDWGNTGGGGDYPDTGSALAKPKAMDNVDIRYKPETTGDSGNGTMIMASLGFLALLSMKQPKGRKRA